MNEISGGPSPFELRDYFRILWRRKWVLTATIILVTGIGLASSLTQTKVYEAEAEVVLSRGETGEGDIATEIRLLESESVRQRARDVLPNVSSVSATPIGESRALRVSAQHTDPALAAESVQVTVRAYIDYRRERRLEELLAETRASQTRIDELQLAVGALEAERVRRLDEIDFSFAPVAGESEDAALEREAEATRAREQLEAEIQSRRNAYLGQQIVLETSLRDQQLASQDTSDDELFGPQIVSPARPPSNPVRPDPVADGITAFGVAILLGIALVFLFEYVDDSILTRADLERAVRTDAAVLGVIPVVSRKRKQDESIVSTTEPRSAAAEAYRSLRTALQFVSLDRPLNRLLVTSPNPREGKSTTVANLAVLFARADRRVTVVSGDLRRPRVHELFNVPAEPGLTSVMIGDVDLPHAIRPVRGVENLMVLPPGPMPPNPAELLSSPRFATLVRTLQATSTMVIVDSPPVLAVTDAAVAAGVTDAVLLVVTVGRSTRKQVRRALETLRQVGTPVAGVVLNQVAASDVVGYEYLPLEPPPPPRSRRRRSVTTTAADGDRGNGAQGPPPSPPADAEEQPATRRARRRSTRTAP